MAKKKDITKKKGEKVVIDEPGLPVIPTLWDFSVEPIFEGTFKKATDNGIIFEDEDGNEFIIPQSQGLLTSLRRLVNGVPANEQPFMWTITLMAVTDGKNQYKIEVE